MLTFHYRSEVEHDIKSNVLDFVSKENINKFKKEFQYVLDNEFPELKNKYSVNKLIIKGITAKTKNRIQILKQFENTKKYNVFILASCQAIGEGVDTKKANQICFVDPRLAYTTIIQNIGRCCRKPFGKMPKATILIPCFVDAKKYEKAEDNFNFFIFFIYLFCIFLIFS